MHINVKRNQRIRIKENLNDLRHKSFAQTNDKTENDQFRLFIFSQIVFNNILQ